MKPKSPVCIEFKETSVHVLEAGHSAEFPIQRQPNGRISPDSAELLTHALRGFLGRAGDAAGREALCAIPARGVTVRPVSIPAQTKEDPRRLIAMQIEAQFPVAPAELAWGCTPLNEGREGLRDYLVAAIRKEALEDYAQLLARAGLTPRFAVAALVRTAHAGPASFLEIGMEKSELTALGENSAPVVRVLNWGKSNGDNLEALLPLLPAGQPLWVSSIHVSPEAVAARLEAMAPGWRVQPLVLANPGQGRTSATLALESLAQTGRTALFLDTSEPAAAKTVSLSQWKWAAAACLLLLLAFSLRYAEAVIFRSQLTKKIAEIDRSRTQLPRIENELGFLNYIKTNQPPYLDTVAVISSAAPPGTRLDQLSVLRRGEVSLRGMVQDPQGPEKLRAKLIDSGFFSKVVVEEQSPNQQNRQQITFRMTAFLKPEELRKPLPPEKPDTNQPATRPPGPAIRPPRPGALPPGGPVL